MVVRGNEGFQFLLHKWTRNVTPLLAVDLAEEEGSVTSYLSSATLQLFINLQKGCAKVGSLVKKWAVTPGRNKGQRGNK